MHQFNRNASIQKISYFGAILNSEVKNGEI